MNPPFLSFSEKVLKLITIPGKISQVFFEKWTRFLDHPHPTRVKCRAECGSTVWNAHPFSTEAWSTGLP